MGVLSVLNVCNVALAAMRKRRHASARLRIWRVLLGVADHELAQMHHVPELPALVAQFDARLRHLDLSVQAVADRVQTLRHRLHIRGADLLAGQRQQAVPHDPAQVARRSYLLHVLQ